MKKRVKKKRECTTELTKLLARVVKEQAMTAIELDTKIMQLKAELANKKQKFIPLKADAIFDKRTGITKCSNCEGEWWYEDETDKDPFCRFCGADLREEQV